MVRYISIILFSYFLINLIGCSHSNAPVDSPPKDPRDYRWTVDTLFFSPFHDGSGQVIINDLWGVHDSALYAACHDAWGGPGSFWKFNGRAWEHVKLGVFEGGFLNQSYSMAAVKGFSERDIYAFGAYSIQDRDNATKFSSQICGVHFNGSRWQEITMPKGVSVRCVDHTSPSMIFCGGFDGQLFVFDGIRWTADTIENKYKSSVPMNIQIAGTTADNGVLFQTEQFDTLSEVRYYRLLKYKDRQLTTITSSTDVNDWGGHEFWQSTEGTLYSCGRNGVFRLSGSKWKQVMEASETLFSIYGSDESHIFVNGENNLFYFNGKAWITLNTGVNHFHIKSKIWCSPNEVFVAFTDAYKTYVLHGK